MSEEGKASNGKSTALAGLLNQLNVPTLLVVLLTGGGNFFATKQNSVEREAQIQLAIRQIRELHEALDDAERGRQKVIEGVTNSLNNQTKLLENQGRMLAGLADLVEQAHRREQNRNNPNYHGP